MGSARRRSSLVGALALVLLGCSGSSSSSTSSGGGSTSATSTSGGGTSSSGTTGSGATTTSSTTSSSTASSGSTSGSSGGVVTGSLGFAVESQQLFERHLPDGGPAPTRLRPKLYSAPLTCADASGTYPALDFEFVELDVATTDGTDVAPGTYDVAAPPANASVSIAYNVHHANGSSEPSLSAASGTVTFTTASASLAEGTFSATVPLPDGGNGTLQGSFSAPYCN